MTLPIYQLLYVSQHDNPVTNGGYSTVIYDIGLEATRRNQLLDVTGFLICTPRWFGQVLEGRTADVDDLMTRIGRDRRHHSVQILFTRTSGVRLFPNWNMGIATADTRNKSLFLRHGLSPQDIPDSEFSDELLDLARDLARAGA